ncbi:hypothetical protein V6N13_149560 [Hibiscus sabdariffa]|uniref:BURP domain-containing protein n=2 Tax=Hibiscus sabdariffa TaxID=183260 RepID=A0ABR2EGZ8_9ROSI
MDNEFVSYSFILLLLATLAPGNVALAASHMEDATGVTSTTDFDGKHSSSHMGMGMDDLVNPAAKVFAFIKDIQVGKTMPIYFPYVSDPASFEFLPEEKIHGIPLSSEQLPELLRFFSFSLDSPQALAMKQTLHMCEAKPLEREVVGCVTSFESLADFAQRFFEPDSRPRLGVLRSSPISDTTPLLQNYTVLEYEEISTGKIIPCHNEPYPYAVYFCHFQPDTVNKVFMVSLGGENGDRVDAVFLCHMDTSAWDAGHISFRLLGVKPGESEICHFFPAYDLVVVPLPW